MTLTSTPFHARKAYEGSDVPTLGPELDHIDVDSAYFEWFKPFDAPDSEYMERTVSVSVS